MLSRIRVPGATLKLPGVGSVRCLSVSGVWAELEGVDGFCAQIAVTSNGSAKLFSMRIFLSSSLMRFKELGRTSLVCWFRSIAFGTIANLSNVLKLRILRPLQRGQCLAHALWLRVVRLS